LRRRKRREEQRETKERPTEVFDNYTELEVNLKKIVILILFSLSIKKILVSAPSVVVGTPVESQHVGGKGGIVSWKPVWATLRDPVSKNVFFPFI
jgi:hypothetical protein